MLVQQHTELAGVGTLAESWTSTPSPDGTSTLLAVGSRRFRLGDLVPGKSYLQAEVEFLDEPVGDLPEHLPDSARALSAEYLRLLAVLTCRGPNPSRTRTTRSRCRTGSRSRRRWTRSTCSHCSPRPPRPGGCGG